MAKLHLVQEILDIIYPVGSIYLSWNSTNPKIYLVEHEQDFLEDLYGCVSSVGTGNGTGTDTNSHTLTIDQMPAHKHQINANWARDKGSEGLRATIANYSTGYIFEPSYLYGEMKETGGGKGHTHTLNSHTHTNPETASSSSVQPYITVYFWVRTA